MTDTTTENHEPGQPAGVRAERPVGRPAPEREWLEKAAVAAGIDGRYFDGSSAIHTGIYRAKHRYYWNPLASDSEALRLAAALNMDVCVNICFCEVVWVDTDLSETHSLVEDWGARDIDLGDRMEYIRRAIVRMAAKVAELQPPNAEVSRARASGGEADDCRHASARPQG